MKWLQGTLYMFIGLFCQYGLVENVAKSKSMTLYMGTLWSGMLEEAMEQ